MHCPKKFPFFKDFGIASGALPGSSNATDINAVQFFVLVDEVLHMRFRRLTLSVSELLSKSAGEGDLFQPGQESASTIDADMILGQREQVKTV